MAGPCCKQNFCASDIIENLVLCFELEQCCFVTLLHPLLFGVVAVVGVVVVVAVVVVIQPK